MADQAEPPVAQAPPGQILSPPTVGASQFIISATPVEFLLTFGHSRVIFNASTGEPSGSAALEWLTTLALSPITAKQLAMAITESVAKYEESMNFTIPILPRVQAPDKK